MAATRITALPAAPSLDYNNDVFPIVDVSTTTPITPTGTTSKATLSQVDAVLSASGNKAIVVDNVAALKALPVLSVTDGQLYITRGYYSDNDGGQGTYIYDSTSAATDNGGTVIAPTSGSGRFLLQYSGELNVKQFGAKGDNSTNDSSAVQAAVTAVPANGTLRFSSGVYLCSSTIAISKSNILIKGESCEIKANTTDQTVVTLNGSNITFESITINGNGKSIRGIQILESSSNVVITKCIVKNCAEFGASTGFAHAIHCLGGVTNLTISQCFIDNIQAPNSGIARGIICNYISSALDSKNIIIDSNTISNVGPVADGDGVVFQNYSGDCNSVISNNSFFECAKRAIKLMSPGIAVTGNTIKNASTPYAAISVYTSSCSITGNLIIGGNFVTGVEIGSPGTSINDISVSSNIIRNSSSGSRGSTEFVRIFGTSVSRCCITNNNFFFARGGIRVEAGLNKSVIANNAISNLSQSAINLIGESTNLPNKVAITGNVGSDISNYFITGSSGCSELNVSGNSADPAFGPFNATTMSGSIVSHSNSWEVEKVQYRGDVDVNLYATANSRVQVFSTTLTGNRTVNLKTDDGPINGSQFRIVRTGLGAFTLNVGPGVKTIPSATAAFVDVSFDGTQWILTGYGTL